MVNIFSTQKKKPEIGMSTNKGAVIYNTSTQPQVYQTKAPQTNSSSLGVYGKSYYSNLNGSKPATYSNSLTPNLDQIKANYPPITPKTTPKPQTEKIVPSAPTETFDQKYQNYLDTTANRREQFSAKIRDEDIANAKATSAATQAGLNEDVISMEDYLNRYKTGQLERADKLKENARTAQGTTQRTLAKQRRDQMSDNEKRYAAMGTIDSYGTGSFTQANENTESDFSRLSAESLMNLEDKLYQIDSDAEDKISIEDAKYQQSIRESKRLLSGDEMALAAAIRKAQLTHDENVMNIRDEKEGLMLQAQQEALKANKKPDVSDTFLTTGKPVEMRDYIYMANNPKYAEALQAYSGSANNQAQNEAKDTVNLIDEIANGDLKYSTGFSGNFPKIPGSQGYDTRRKIEQLKSQLQLASVGKLKGQGQVSDAERKILADAATQLDQGMSEQAFRDELQRVRSILERNNNFQISNPLTDLASQYGL